MQIEFTHIDFLVGDVDILQNMVTTPALQTFSSEVIDFLADLSKALLKDPKTRPFVDIISYAY